MKINRLCVMTLATMHTIDIIYARAGTTGDTGGDSSDNLSDSSKANSIPDCTYRWPLIDGEVANDVEKQLRESVSIYDNSGIIGRFEHAWKMYHGSAESFTLLHNSGTNALQALYFAAQLQPGDEVGCLYLPLSYLAKYNSRSSFPFTASTQPAPQPCNLGLSRSFATLLMTVISLPKL